MARTRTISESDKKLMLEVKEAIIRLIPDAEVILYGSTARGTRKPGSDYDILALTGCNLSAEETRAIQAAIYGIEVARDAVIYVAVCSHEEWDSFLQGDPFRENVIREWVVL